MYRKVMITLFVEEYNPLTPSFYNQVINNLQFHMLTCPCGHSGCLSVHGYYYRYIKSPTGKIRGLILICLLLSRDKVFTILIKGSFVCIINGFEHLNFTTNGSSFFIHLIGEKRYSVKIQ